MDFPQRDEGLLRETRLLIARYNADESLRWASRAATDSRLPTADLLIMALEEVRLHRETENGGTVPALVVLNERSDDETRLAALSLLGSPDAAERELAAWLMREFGPTALVPRSNASEFLPALIQAVEAENDHDALVMELAAIGWQGLLDAQSVLLRYAKHTHPRVRETVGGQLLTLSAIHGELSSEVAMALLTQAHDDDAGVAWSVLYDVADTPHLFIEYREEFLQAARNALNAIDDQLRETAEEALVALELLEPAA